MTGRPSACIVSAVRPACDVRAFHRMARSLAAAGFDVTVIGRDPGPPRTDGGIRILPLPTVRGAARVALQARAMRLALATRADVTQVTDVELLPAALLLRRAGRPVVYECREDYPAYMLLKPWLPPRARPAVARAVDRMERLAARRLDAVIVADAATARRLQGHGGRVALLHNFPRRAWFTPASPGAARPHDVVYHGSLPAYHLETLGAIARGLARQVAEARWTIVGTPDATAAGAAFTRGLVADGLADRVQLRPRIAFPDVPAFLQGARTGIVPLQDVPKFRSNIPVKLFEYLAAGVPAVASDLPPTRALLDGTDAAVLVPPDDHAAFADALAGLLRDPARAEAQARRGRAAMEERFHWEREEPTLLRLYGELLGGPAMGHA
jgi:glycosyltransferase involved in cell wall biosynthesis